MTAASLRAAAGVIAIACARRSSGRDTLAFNLAVLFGDLGKQVLLIDFDESDHETKAMAAPGSALGAIVRRTTTLTVASVPELVGPKAAQPNPKDYDLLLGKLDRAASQADFTFILPPAGDGPATARMIDGADATLLVITPEPKAMSDSYSLLKTVAAHRHDTPILLLANMARDRGDAEQTARQLQDAARHYLRMHLGSVGFVPYDPAVERAAAHGKWFVATAPESHAARRLKRAAGLLSRWLRNPDYSLVTYLKQTIDIEAASYAAGRSSS